MLVYFLELRNCIILSMSEGSGWFFVFALPSSSLHPSATKNSTGHNADPADGPGQSTELKCQAGY